MHSPIKSVDVGLLGGVALAAGGLAIVAPAEVVVASGLAFALACTSRRLGSTPWAALVVVALGVALGALRAERAVRRYEEDALAADAAWRGPARCSALARVSSSPVVVRGVLRWDATISRVRCESAVGKTSPESSDPGPADRDGGLRGLATLYGGPPDLARGDEAEVVATLAAPQRLWNASSGDPRPGQAHRGVVRTGGTLDVRVVHRSGGVFARIDRARASVRRRIDATFAPDLAAMARALVLGESDLNESDDQAFRASGLSHLLAVSGMHLVLVLALVVHVLHGALVRIERLAGRVDAGRVVAAIAVPATWAYAEFAGAGGSTLRAAWMATAALVARALGRRGDATRAFGLSLGAMALADPLVAYDLSFSLSAGATAGLLAFGRPLSERFVKAVPARAALLAPVARAVATTIAASLPCVPMIARFAPTVPLGGVVANVFAVPIGECAALPLCLAHALLGPWAAAERGAATLASGALVLVRAIARIASVPAVTASIPQPTSWQLVTTTVALAAVVLGAKRRMAWVSAAAGLYALLGILARRAGAPRGLLRATFLDVGQGDAAIVDLPDGEAMVIDGGGLVGSPIDVGERVLGPELRARRRGAIAVAVLTHPHPDHFGGLVSGLSAVRVGELWDTGQGEREGVGGGYAALRDMARARGVRVLSPEDLCGERQVGGARIEVLAPCPTFSSDLGPNDNSFVIRISFGARAFLFVGDAEREEESTLLSGPSPAARLRADVLKVGHHGSRTSSAPRFLAAIGAEEAVISVGLRNRFGHPNPATLQALAMAGARVWRTDRNGEVVISTDGASLTVEAANGAP